MERENRNNYAKNCHLCTNNIKHVDYKDVELLKKFIDPYAKMLGKRRSGLCAGHQREISEAIKRARFLALMPFLSR